MNRMHKKLISLLLSAAVIVGATVTGLAEERAQGAPLANQAGAESLLTADNTEETGHRVLISGSYHDRIALIEKDGSTIWELPGMGSLWTEVNDADLLENGNLVFASRSDADGSYVRLIRPNYEEKTGYDLLWEYKVPEGAEAHTCQPIDDGGFLVGEAYSDYIRIVELDANGNIRKTVGSREKKLEGFDGTGGTHGQIRQVTKTKDGTYLAVHFTKNITVEFDGEGNTVRTYPFGTGFMAVKQDNGNVLISGGNTPALKEYNEAGELVWEVGRDDIPGVTLGFAAAIDILPNGNIVLANWGGHGGASGVSAVIEINRDKELVWYLKSEDGGNISNVQVFDDLNVDFTPDPDEEVPDESSEYRSPLDVEANIRTGMVYVADHTNCSIQVIRSSTDKLAAVIPLDYQPTALCLTEDGSRLYVAAGGADGKVIEIETAGNTVVRTMPAGHTPSALVLSDDEQTLYVANRFDGNVQEIELSSGTAARSVQVTREPMAMELAGRKLYVAGHLPTGSSQEDVISSEVVAIDLSQFEDRGTQQVIKFANGSTNAKDLALSPDGRYLYVTHALGRNMVATTQEDRGWIYTNAVSEIDTASGKVTATMPVDDMDLGAGNPWGIEATDDKLYIAIAGTRELIFIDRTKMREKVTNVTNGTLFVQGLLQEPADIANDLTFLTEMKTRIDLDQDGPRGLAVLGNKVYVANYYGGSVSVVNSKTTSQETITFQTTAQEDDVRAGERLWNDATIGFQNWQSCASCHPDARADALNWDNLNDGIGTPKQARTMLDTFRRGRVMATGIRANASVAVRAGLKYIMFNGNFSEENFQKLDAYVQSLEPEASPYLEDGKLSESALRGKSLFEGKAGCAQCHAGEIKGQDILIYNYTQTGNESRGLLVPPLREVWRTAPYLCDGRAATVREVLVDYNPIQGDGTTLHGNVQDLSESELDDLITYVLSLSNEEEEPDRTLEELKNLVNTAKDKLFGNYTEESKQALTTQIEAAEAVTAKGDSATAEEIGGAYAQLQAAIDGLVDASEADKEDLLALYNANKDKTKGDYTDESWATFAAALEQAADVLENEDASQKEVDDALAALQAAVDGLTTEEPGPGPDVDKKELQELYEIHKDKLKGNYTDASWNVFLDALAEAQRVLADESATQQQVDEAAQKLTNAVSGLTENPPEPVDKTLLQSLYDANKDRRQGSYTDSSWQVFQNALEKAKEVLENPAATQIQIDEAKANLEAAVQGLESKPVNKSTLKVVLDLAKGHIDNGDVDKLVPSAQEQFMNVYQSAQEVYGDLEAEQSEVDDAWKRLLYAIQGLDFEAGDKTALNDLVAKAGALDQDQYLDGETKDAFNAALREAIGILGDKDALKADIDKAYQALEDAMQALIPVESKADKTALKTVIDEAESYNLSDYVDGEAEKQAFRDALATAKAIYEKEDANQAEIDQARMDLLDAMAKLKLRADKSMLEEWLNKLKAIDLTQYTQESGDVARAAIAQAESLLAQDLSDDEEGLIQAAILAMREAEAGLVPLQGSVEDPGMNSGSSQTQNGQTTTTGDQMPAAAVSLMAFAAVGLLLLYRKRKT